MAVHPRVCGELFHWPPWAFHSAGSSPRVRGTPSTTRTLSTMLRFIPACAGNSAKARRLLVVTSVHPRVCGELRRRCLTPRTACGSSPRVRGTLDHGRAPRRGRRFIPACAGNSRTAALGYGYDIGSSPRVRGTRGDRLPQEAAAPVHPRVCGELLVLDASGAPPVRFIPACAGNSCSTWTRKTAIAVHPRVCGELHTTRQVSRALGGSSPRVRGTLFGEEDAMPPNRFIPACAGNSG